MKGATPLMAIDAFAIDTETTGLDLARARIVEIAVVAISRGRLDTGNVLRTLVRPGEPIPGSAARIHGIDDQAVASSPSFREAWPEFATRLVASPLIGHSIGFDLAIIGRECQNSELAPPSQPFLDISLLARIVAPRLPGYSLEQLASWLEVGIEQRHSALGDATAAARIFCAMVPRLRGAGIRTLAEAQRACLDMGTRIESHLATGWVEPSAPAPSPDESRVPPRLDSAPYRYRARDAMRPPRFLPEASRLEEAMSVMLGEKISSVFATASREAFVAANTGILTERDAMRALGRLKGEAFEMPVARFASRPLITVKADDFTYKAIARMQRFNIRHLAVEDEAGRIVGALSARDLLKSGASLAVAVGDEIEHSDTVPDLAAAWARIPGLVRSLRADGVDGRQIACIVSQELGLATMAACAIGERRLQKAGQGGSPCPYAMAVLGSAGRGESLLALDQDNALIFAEGEPDGPEDQWFAKLGTETADILHEIGIPYCKGGVMASNPSWRGSLTTWRKRIGEWTRRSHPADILSVDIFFDLKSVCGPADLGEGLRQEAFSTAGENAAFCKLLADAVSTIEPGLGLFGRFRTENGRIDLKRAGLFGIVAAARALAVRHHILAPSTPERLEGVKTSSAGGETDLDNLLEAQATFLDLIVDQQIDDMAHGIPPSNRVVVKSLSRRAQERLRFAFRSVRHIDDLTRELLFRG